MYLIVFEILNKYSVRFCQYLVMYLVPEVKGLPGGVDLVCHAGLDPLGYYYYYGMQSNQYWVAFRSRLPHVL